MAPILERLDALEREVKELREKVREIPAPYVPMPVGPWWEWKPSPTDAPRQWPIEVTCLTKPAPLTLEMWGRVK